MRSSASSGSMHPKVPGPPGEAPSATLGARGGRRRHRYPDRAGPEPEDAMRRIYTCLLELADAGLGRAARAPGP